MMPEQFDPQRGLPVAVTAYGDRGQAALKIINNYTTGDFVRQRLVPAEDLIVCKQYFVPPRQREQLDVAAGYLKSDGIVVLNAPRGTGRRTVALKLLVDQLRTEIVDLEPEWDKPDVKLLPTEPVGYILHLSGLSENERRLDFTQDLIKYGRDSLDHGRLLIVLVTPSDWTGDWATKLPTVKLTSPDSRALVEQELKQARARRIDHSQAPDQLDLLDHESLGPIWKSNPPAAEAVRLAGMLEGAAADDVPGIVDEFTGWHDYIEEVFKGSNGKPALGISDRATWWAGALLYEGNYQTVLAAATALLTKFGVQQSAAEIMSGPTSTKRLGNARLKRDGTRVVYEEPRADLAVAVLRHLSEEFPTHHDDVVSWAVSLAASPNTPDEDAALAVNSLVQLAVDSRNGNIVNKIGTELGAGRRSIVAAGLTKAALDPELGDYVRHRLLQWSRGSGDLAKLAAAVCGGRLGEERTDIALTRLRWAAGSLVTGPDAAVVIDAFRNLVIARPHEVDQAVRSWLTGNKSQAESDRAVLALALSDEGSLKLIALARERDVRRPLVDTFQRLLLEETAELTTACVDRWEGLIAAGRATEAELRPLLIDFYRPDLQRLVASKFLPEGVELESTLRGRALNEFLQTNSQRRTEAEEG